MLMENIDSTHFSVPFLPLPSITTIHTFRFILQIDVEMLSEVIRGRSEDEIWKFDTNFAWEISAGQYRRNCYLSFSIGSVWGYTVRRLQRRDFNILINIVGLAMGWGWTMWEKLFWWYANLELIKGSFKSDVSCTFFSKNISKFFFTFLKIKKKKLY
jgi:hypothetical protein